MVRYVAELPVDVIEANIASAIDLVVQTKRAPHGGRYVSDVVSFAFDRDKGRCLTRPIYQRPVGRQCGRWEAFPDWVGELVERGVSGEEEVEAWKQACSSAV